MSPLLKKNHAAKDKIGKYCLISGIAAAIIMYIVYIAHENTLAFGNMTVLRMDLYHQYGPLYAELYDRIVNHYSLAYSWTSGLGGSFMGNLFNYCCSPFALIMLLCRHENMPEAIALMIMLKAVLSAVSFTYYINKSTGKTKVVSIGFGLLYAFSGYFVAYSWNIMWLDAMAVFPLVILGIERIIQHRKPTVYIAAMTYTMLTNYYMAFMVCILSVIYFLYFYLSRYELLSPFRKPSETEETEDAASSSPEDEQPLWTGVFADENKSCDVESVTIEADSKTDIMTEAEMSESIDTESVENVPAADNPEVLPVEETSVVDSAEKKTSSKKKKNRLFSSRFFRTGVTFALASFLCFFLSAFALLPVAYCLTNSSATGGSMPENLKIYFNVFDFLANHLPGLTTTIRSSGDVVLPNVYCGIISVILLPLFFFSKRVSGKKKVVLAVLLGFFYLSFSMNNLNYFWHGLHMPNDLPFRYSFGYSFILLTVAYQVLMNLDEFPPKAYIASGFAVMGFVILVQKAGSLNVDTEVIVLSLMFTLFYVILFGLIISGKYRESGLAVLTVLLIILEISFADSPNFVMSQPKDAYTSDYHDYQNAVELTEKEDKELFYRTELTKLRTRMDPCWYGYNGISTFSSMAQESCAKLMECLGMFSNNINSYTYYPQTPVFNSMFNIRYLYDNDSLIKEGDFYKLKVPGDKFTSYEYNYYLPLAFAVNGDIMSFDKSNEDPFVVQNNLMECATGIKDVFEIKGATSFETNNVADVEPSVINLGLNFAINKTASGSNGTGTAVIDVEDAGYYYVYSGSTRVSTVTVTADNYYYSYSSSAIQPFMLDVGYQPEGAQIKVAYTLSDNDTATVAFTAAKLNERKFSKAYDILKNNGTLELDSFSETEFAGKINVTGSDKILYTSIPYDEGWNIFIDGERVSYDSDRIVKIGDALLGVKMSDGDHDVRFRYIPRGLGTGIKITSLGLALVAFLLIFKFWIVDMIREKKPGFLSDYYPDGCAE